jgi:hypothetical protein
MKQKKQPQQPHQADEFQIFAESAKRGTQTSCHPLTISRWPEMNNEHPDE